MRDEFDIERVNRSNFRSALHAMSHPGRSYPVLPLFDAGLLALASVLLYGEVSYHYEGALDFQVVNALTGASQAARETADYLFSDTAAVSHVEAAKAGSAEHPEHGATILIDCSLCREGTPVRLSGPGIDGSIRTSLPLSPHFLNCLIRKNSKFPQGVDLFLLPSRDRLVALARTTAIEVLL